MSLNSYVNLNNLHLTKHKGDYVHIYHDAFLVGATNNVLGKFDDHNVGKILAIKDGCAEVQYGSEANVGTYNLGSLALVSVGLKPTAINKTGSLGNPSEKKKGIIVDWSNFGKGDIVKVLTSKLSPATDYNQSDLEFEINSNVAPITTGGSRRVTLRKKKLPSKYTRMIKRV